MNDAFVPHEAYALLQARGVPRWEVERAEAAGTLHLLVMDRLLLPDPPKYTQNEVAELAGMTIEDARRFWLALGFPHVPDEERAFTEHDLNALTTVHGLISLGITDAEAAVHMARVIGSSMNRVAEASVSAQPQIADPADSERMAELYALMGGATLDGTSQLLDYVWRRHLQAVVRRAMAMEDTDPAEEGVAIGFADLVGFTALSQQLSQAALADVVGRFEELAHDTVAACGGRVVKMIGDEVMFASNQPAEAARTSLSLAEAYSDDEQLRDVRVGLAYGPVLAREGDYYGPVVNRASRMVGIARPGSVLVSTDVHDALAGKPEFEFRQLRPRHLQGLGRVPLWALMRADDEPPPGSGRRDGRKGRARRPGVMLPLPEAVRERMEHGRQDFAELLGKAHDVGADTVGQRGRRDAAGDAGRRDSAGDAGRRDGEGAQGEGAVEGADGASPQVDEPA